MSTILYKRMRPLSSSPNKSNTWTMCSLPMCRGLWRGVHKCARLCFGVHSLCTCVGFGCARCARCAGRSLALTAVFSECFAKCAQHLQNVSDSVAELDAPRNPFDDSDELCADQEKTAPERISAWGAKASPGAESGSFSVRREKWRLFRGRPGPSGGGFGDLAKSGAPAAILINAYSGDFCHPVLSNALAQEPLVYHSGTRELFSDIFGNTSKTDGTESDIFGNSDFFEILLKFAKKLKNCAHP